MSQTFLQRLQVTPSFAAFPKRLPLPGGAGGPVARRGGASGLSRRSRRVRGSRAALGTAGRVLGSFEAIRSRLKGMDCLFSWAICLHRCRQRSSLHPPSLLPSSRLPPLAGSQSCPARPREPPPPLPPPPPVVGKRCGGPGQAVLVWWDELGVPQALGCGCPRGSASAWGGMAHRCPRVVPQAPLGAGSFEIGLRLGCRRSKISSALATLMPPSSLPWHRAAFF